MSLWKALSTPEGVYIKNPEGVTKLKVYGCDELFARQLARILNSTPAHKFTVTEEGLDMLGAPKVIK